MKPPSSSRRTIDAEDIQHAGEIAAPPASVADPVPPPIASHANPRAAAMASRPLWKTFLLFLAPMLLSNILQSLSGTLNNVYLGQMIGVGALAAVSSFFPVMFFFIAFTIGLGAGASVLIGQAWGAREPDKARAVAGTTLTVGVLFGLCVALFGGAFTEPMLRVLGTPPDILADATSYARIILIAMPGLFVFLLSTAMLRGVGDTVTPLYTLMISTVLGLAITPALIKGWFGLPQLGVASGACATVISFVVATAWLGFHLRRKKSVLAPDADFMRHLRVRPALLKAVLKVGVPTGRADDRGLAGRDRAAVLRQCLRLQRDRGLRRGEPGRGLRAVPGHLDRDHGVHPRRAGHRRRAGRSAWAPSRAPRCR